MTDPVFLPTFPYVVSMAKAAIESIQSSIDPINLVPTWFSLPTNGQKSVITAFYPCRCSISWAIEGPIPQLPDNSQRQLIDPFEFADVYLGGRANWYEEVACKRHGGPERRTVEQEKAVPL